MSGVDIIQHHRSEAGPFQKSFTWRWDQSGDPPRGRQVGQKRRIELREDKKKSVGVAYVPSKGNRDILHVACSGDREDPTLFGADGSCEDIVTARI